MSDGNRIPVKVYGRDHAHRVMETVNRELARSGRGSGSFSIHSKPGGGVTISSDDPETLGRLMQASRRVR